MADFLLSYPYRRLQGQLNPVVPLQLQCGRQTSWRLDVLKGSAGTDTYAVSADEQMGMTAGILSSTA